MKLSSEEKQRKELTLKLEVPKLSLCSVSGCVSIIYGS